MNKAFDTVLIEGLLYKLTVLNFPSYLIHIISSYLWGRTFEASFLTATLSRRGMRAGLAQGGLISPVLFSLYVNDMPKPSHHVELALYADDTAIIATSRTPLLLVSYLQAYLSHLERWLTKWRIAINVSELRDHLRASRTALHSARSVTFRGANQLGRYHSLSGGDPGLTTYLVASHRTGEQENYSKDGFARSSPEQQE